MSYCEVDFSGISDDAEPCEFSDRRWVVARKAHSCSECKAQIATGERHEVVAYKYDGVFGSDRWCAACREIASEFEYFIVGGSLWEAVAEEWSQGARVQACINRLSTVAAKAKMRDRWIAWKFVQHDRQPPQLKPVSPPSKPSGTA